MSITPTSTNNTGTQRIEVNQDGLFQVDGRTLDMIGLVFSIQNETKLFAQNRLTLTAQQLWDSNEEAKQLIFLLNHVRGMRPTGDADATVKADKVEEVFNSYSTEFGKSAIKQYDLKDLCKFGYSVKYNGRTVRNFNQHDARDSLGKQFVDTLVLGVSKGKNFRTVDCVVTMNISDMKQAEVDQLIEGIKSQISSVSSRQELLNNDTQKYTRLADETKEAMSAIEKSIANFLTNEESKI